jgi:hypothetical protein
MTAAEGRRGPKVALAVTAAALAAGGLGVGLGHAWGVSREPKWAVELRLRADEEARVLDEQQRGLSALAGALSAITTARGLSEGCVTSSVLRAELDARARAPSLAAGVTAGAARAARAPDAPEQAERALEEATRLVERASSTGEWNEADAVEFRTDLGAMTPELHDQAMSALFRALNDGRLKLTAHAPL